MCRISVLVLVIVTGLSDLYRCEAWLSASTPIQRSKDESVDSPVEVARRFLLAMAKADLKELEAVALPDKELALLVSGVAASDAQLEDIRRVQFSHLQLGDEFTVPTPEGPVTVVMDRDRINENRRQLTSAGNPIPIDVLRTDD